MLFGNITVVWAIIISLKVVFLPLTNQKLPRQGEKLHIYDVIPKPLANHK